MKKPSVSFINVLICSAAFAMIPLRITATPTCDEDTTATGCITPPGGGKANFNLSANFDVDTHTFSGHLTYADTNANVDITSNDINDYGTVGGNVRTFKFQITNDNYDEARVITTDNGDSASDGFELQLLKSGNIVYQASGSLTSDCPGGVLITEHCDNQPPCLIQLTVQCAVDAPSSPPSMNDCEGKVVKMIMKYTRDDCSKMIHHQAAGKALCSGNSGQLPESVYIRVTDNSSAKDFRCMTFFKGTVQAGQNYTIDAGVVGALKANTYIYIYDAPNGKLLQSVQVHTSCSQPLAAGDQFGANLLVSLTTTKGGTDTVSNPTPMPSSDSCFITGTNTTVDFFYTIRNAGTNSLPLSSLSGTDAFGSLDLSSLGSGSIAPGEEVTVMVTEPVAGPFPFTNIVTISGGQTSDQCSASASVIIKQAGSDQNPPPAQCDDFITGGGWIVGTPSGDRANFGVHGGIKHGLWGGLNYIDHHTGMHVKSTAVTGYTHLSDVGRQINFDVKIDGQPGTAIVKAYDNGEPGRNDLFSIQLSNGYTASGDLGGPRPGGGNIQLHKSKCDQDQDHGQDHDKDKCPHTPKCKSRSDCDHKIQGDKDKENKDKLSCSHSPKCKSKSECEARQKRDKDDNNNAKFKCPHHPQCETKMECVKKQSKGKK
jgi:hypothetical protein